MTPQIIEQTEAKAVFGFWVYLMTDCVLFAALFATYAVMQGSTFGGPSAARIIDLSPVLLETLLLLTSSFTMGLALVAAGLRRPRLVVALLVVTALLGLGFLGLEWREFSHLVSEGNGWQRSGFLSAFFTLIGTHGLHITVGLLWMLVVMIEIISRGLVPTTLKRLTLLSMFWHFLDLIWIFIFTIVYLRGVI